MAGAAIAAIVVGTAVTAYGQIQAGESANKVAKRKAELMNRNATIAQQNAEFNAKLHERDTRRRRAYQFTQLNPGTVKREGTNLIAIATQEFTDDRNAQLIRRGGIIESQNLMAEAELTSFGGKSAKRAGYTAAGGSLLTGWGGAGVAYGKGAKSGLGSMKW